MIADCVCWIIPVMRYTALASVVLASVQFAVAQPVAKKIPHETKVHGVTLTDDYFWLRDKKNPEVIAYLEAENAYTDSVMKGTEALQQKLYEEDIAFVKPSDLDIPYMRDGYYYYTRREAGKEYDIYARKKGSLTAPEEIILDLNDLAKGHQFLSLGAYALTPDANLLAYAIDTTGDDRYTLRIKDRRTGELLPEQVENVDNATWSADGKTLFYVTQDKVTQRPDSLYRHVPGSTKDELLYHEPDVMYRLRMSKTRDRALILIDSYSKKSNEVRYIRSDDASSAPRVIVPRKEGHLYIVEHRDDRFYIRTNDHAPNYRLVIVSEKNPSMEHWREVIPARRDVELFEVNVFRDYMAVSEVKDGNRTIRIVDLRNGKSTPISFPEPVYNVSRDANPDFNTRKFRYRYNSLLQPEAIYEFDMEKHFNTLLKQDPAPATYDASQYGVERIYATAPDGVKVPLSLVYKKPLVRDGKRPMLLYSYGSYGIPLWPFFVKAQIPLIDRGAIYAIANVRGGGGMGQAWREAGTMMRKRNTFTDFIASAEQLVKDKYTSSDRLVITGQSAGGLLVGAVATMRPDLFKAVVATSPFVDILNTMLDPSLPLVTNEYIEWGNPTIQKEFEYIRSYSPYDNIRRTAYPAMLVTVSLNDTRVSFWEGTKFVAKLRAMKTDSNPVLLKVNMGGGHGGSSGRYDSWRDYAFIQAFMLQQMGIAN